MSRSDPADAMRLVTLDGIELEWRQELDGGAMSFAGDVVEVIDRSFGRVRHICEVCSGVGVLGLRLLARGCCERLTLVDVNPDAIRIAQRSIRRNGLEGQADALVADGLPRALLRDVDLVFGNPPHFATRPPWLDDVPDLVLVDRHWRLHHAVISTFMECVRRDASLLLIENTYGSRPGDLLGRFGGTRQWSAALATDASVGQASIFYYLSASEAVVGHDGTTADRVDEALQVVTAEPGATAFWSWEARAPLTVVLSPLFPPGTSAWLEDTAGSRLLHGLPLAANGRLQGLRRNHAGGLTLSVQPGRYRVEVVDQSGNALAEAHVLAE